MDEYLNTENTLHIEQEPTIEKIKKLCETKKQKLAYKKQYYQEHKEQILAYQKRYYQEHKEEINNRKRQRYRDRRVIFKGD